MSTPTLKEILKPGTDTVSAMFLEQIGIPGYDYQLQQLNKSMPPPKGQGWVQSPARDKWFLARLPIQTRLEEGAKDHIRDKAELASLLKCRPIHLHMRKAIIELLPANKRAKG